MICLKTITDQICRGFLCHGIFVLALASGTCAAGSAPEVRRVSLADTRMAATEEARKLLKYLANCALDGSTVLTASYEGIPYEFPGGLGLAPHWAERALTLDEQQAVSACILARTNFYGVKVEISMRAALPNTAPSLAVSETERLSYPVQEGTYFGNLFTDTPTAYVCSPAFSPAHQQQLRDKKRLCALPLAEDPAQTACHFLYIGPCSDAGFTQKGVRYQQAIEVFLKN